MKLDKKETEMLWSIMNDVMEDRNKKFNQGEQILAAKLAGYLLPMQEVELKGRI